MDPSGRRPSLGSSRPDRQRVWRQGRGKVGAALAHKLPEPWTSDEAKQVLDTALTILTRLGDYEFDPPLGSETQDEVMAYAIGAVSRRGAIRN